jgi:hypothetical protein
MQARIYLLHRRAAIGRRTYRLAWGLPPRALTSRGRIHRIRGDRLLVVTAPAAKRALYRWSAHAANGRPSTRWAGQHAPKPTDARPGTSRWARCTPTFVLAMAVVVAQLSWPATWSGRDKPCHPRRLNSLIRPLTRFITTRGDHPRALSKSIDLNFDDHERKNHGRHALPDAGRTR